MNYRITAYTDKDDKTWYTPEHLLTGLIFGDDYWISFDESFETMDEALNVIDNWIEEQETIKLN